jgi:hypothetical protein
MQEYKRDERRGKLACPSSSGTLELTEAKAEKILFRQGGSRRV